MSSEEDVICAIALLYAYKNHTLKREKKVGGSPKFTEQKY